MILLGQTKHFLVLNFKTFHFIIKKVFNNTRKSSSKENPDGLLINCSSKYISYTNSVVNLQKVFTRFISPAFTGH